MDIVDPFRADLSNIVLLILFRDLTPEARIANCILKDNIALLVLHAEEGEPLVTRAFIGDQIENEQCVIIVDLTSPDPVVQISQKIDVAPLMIMVALTA